MAACVQSCPDPVSQDKVAAPGEEASHQDENACSAEAQRAAHDRGFFDHSDALLPQGYQETRASVKEPAPATHTDLVDENVMGVAFEDASQQGDVVCEATIQSDAEEISCVSRGDAATHTDLIDENITGVVFEDAARQGDIVCEATMQSEAEDISCVSRGDAATHADLIDENATGAAFEDASQEGDIVCQATMQSDAEDISCVSRGDEPLAPRCQEMRASLEVQVPAADEDEYVGRTAKGTDEGSDQERKVLLLKPEGKEEGVKAAGNEPKDPVRQEEPVPAASLPRGQNTWQSEDTGGQGQEGLAPVSACFRSGRLKTWQNSDKIQGTAVTGDMEDEAEIRKRRRCERKEQDLNYALGEMRDKEKTGELTGKNEADAEDEAEMRKRMRSECEEQSTNDVVGEMQNEKALAQLSGKNHPVTGGALLEAEMRKRGGCERENEERNDVLGKIQEREMPADLSDNNTAFSDDAEDEAEVRKRRRCAREEQEKQDALDEKQEEEIGHRRAARLARDVRSLKRKMERDDEKLQRLMEARQQSALERGVRRARRALDEAKDGLTEAKEARQGTKRRRAMARAERNAEIRSDRLERLSARRGRGREKCRV